MSLESYSTGFETFWKAWPTHHRKCNKKGCYKKWIVDDLECRTHEIVKAVQWFKKSDEWRKGFIPLTQTWLNQARYDAVESLDVPKAEPVVFKDDGFTRSAWTAEQLAAVLKCSATDPMVIESLAAINGGLPLSAKAPPIDDSFPDDLFSVPRAKTSH